MRRRIKVAAVAERDAVGDAEPSRNRRNDTGPLGTACLAPRAQLFFRPDGDVRVCCRNETPLGNITNDRLDDIWSGKARRSIIDALDRYDYSEGCQHCGSEVAAEGRAGAYPSEFDTHEAALAGGPISRPRHMEFVLSINCNLQCGQCNGDSSSAIRMHREGLPPMPKVYGDRFFDDLRGFLPDLATASFSGGEPFLAEENFRVWELLAELAPHVAVTIVTNATQWTPRVESVLSRLDCSFRLSIDGVTPEVFESIRVGADFDRVMANVDRFVAYARQRGTTVGINHCLMLQNAHEFPDLLIWADQLDVDVHVHVVRDDTRLGTGGELFSIVRSEPATIRAVFDMLSNRDAEVRTLLGRNLGVWEIELARLRSWAASTPEELRSLWGVSGAKVLMFTAVGAGPVSDDIAMAELAEAAPGGIVHRLTWGRSESVLDASPSFRQMLGPERTASVLGGGGREVIAALEGVLGPMQEYRVTSESNDRVDAVAEFATAHVRTAMVALRDEHGWADSASQLFAIAPRTSADDR